MNKKTLKIMSTLSVSASCVNYILSWCDRQDVDAPNLPLIKAQCNATISDLKKLMADWPCKTNAKHLDCIKACVTEFDNTIQTQLGGYRPPVILMFPAWVIPELSFSLKPKYRKWLDLPIEDIAKLHDLFDPKSFHEDSVVDDLKVVIKIWDKVTA